MPQERVSKDTIGDRTGHVYSSEQRLRIRHLPVCVCRGTSNQTRYPLFHVHTPVHRGIKQPSDAAAPQRLTWRCACPASGAHFSYPIILYDMSHQFQHGCLQPQPKRCCCCCCCWLWVSCAAPSCFDWSRIISHQEGGLWCTCSAGRSRPCSEEQPSC